MNIQLVMFDLKGQRKEFPLENPLTVVGREDKCDIRIPVTEVSRKHAEVRLSDKGVRVKDLGSANGTFVNNKRIKEKELVAGDHLVIGPVVFTVQINGEPKQIKPTKTKLEPASRFVPEDDLAAGLEDSSSKKPLSPDDSDAALEVLNAVPDGSSLEFELDEDLDLSDSDLSKD